MEDVMIPLVEPLLADFGLELIDFDRSPQIIRITVDQEGGVDLDTIAKATRAISERFDELDIGIGRYTLEISSPGVERRLRTATHFARAIGESVTIKLTASASGIRRLDGVVSAATETDVTITTASGDAVVVALDTIDRARTVYNWGSTSKPSPSKATSPKKAAAKTSKPKPKLQSTNELTSEERAATR